MAASAEQQLRERVVNTLWSDACKSILFDLDGTTITSASYLWAAHYISAGKVGIKVESQKAGVGASYNQKKNFISFPNANYGMTDFDQMTIVHECTHLFIDSTKKKTLGEINEMCAYIAGATFLEAQGKAGPTNNSIFLAATIVSKHVVAGQDLNADPNRRDVSNLRYAVYGNPIYDYINKDRRFDYGQDGV